MEPLLAAHDLRVEFRTTRGTLQALAGVSFDVMRGEVFGLVGETGCGKTVTGLSVLRLVPPPGRITSGRILFSGQDLMLKSETQMQQIRGARISMIFQDPSSSLNPVFTAGSDRQCPHRAARRSRSPVPLIPTRPDEAEPPRRSDRRSCRPD